jgi:double-stranded uracil-DNA glycosylase
MEPIRDHLKNHLKILFVGFNPSIRSSETGHHFANPNNRFWTILYRAGLTPWKLSALEDDKLLDLGFGLTNIVARPTKTAQEITKDEYKNGKEELSRKINRYKPQIVCFVGKGVYQEYAEKKDIPWGVQSPSVVEGTIDFVAPSSSGLVRMKMEEIIRIYSELPKIVSQLQN